MGNFVFFLLNLPSVTFGACLCSNLHFAVSVFSLGDNISSKLMLHPKKKIDIDN